MPAALVLLYYVSLLHPIMILLLEKQADIDQFSVSAVSGPLREKTLVLVCFISDFSLSSARFFSWTVFSCAV